MKVIFSLDGVKLELSHDEFVTITSTLAKEALRGNESAKKLVKNLPTFKTIGDQLKSPS